MLRRCRTRYGVNEASSQYIHAVCSVTDQLILYMLQPFVAGFQADICRCSGPFVTEILQRLRCQEKTVIAAVCARSQSMAMQRLLAQCKQLA